MYYFNMFACLGGIIAALSVIKSLDLSAGLTAAIAIPVILFGVFGISWFSAKESASEAARNKVK
jgi:hypothetical protein